MIELSPIAYVRSHRGSLADDYWGGSTATIELVASCDPDMLLGIETFSHAEIIYYFHRVEEAKIVRGARHPRNQTAWPLTGILAQRAKNRPNRLGSSIVRVLSRDGRNLQVAELDAVDGTPILDIKPVMQEFLPRGPLKQPPWSIELMSRYYLPEAARPEGEED